MATTPLFSQHQLERDETEPKATWGMFIAAGILALLIGLSAVDIQRDLSNDGHQTQNPGQGDLRLDGRGKWAGYF